MQIKAIASGSNGNCILIRSENTAVLIDAGISCKRIKEESLKAGQDPAKLSAIFITHEHSDHISGLPVFLKHYPVPLYAGAGTIAELRKKMPDTDPCLFHEVRPGESFHVGDLSILPIRTFHDAADPLAFRVDSPEGAAAVMTDTGSYTQNMIEALAGLNVLLLESNHDIRMVEAGSYPYPLKRRILGDYGHLSNERAGEILVRLLNPSLHLVLLGHISEENNYPDIALMTVNNALREMPADAVPDDLKVLTLSRYESSEVFTV